MTANLVLSKLSSEKRYKTKNLFSFSENQYNTNKNFKINFFGKAIQNKKLVSLFGKSIQYKQKLQNKLLRKRDKYRIQKVNLNQKDGQETVFTLSASQTLHGMFTTGYVGIFF